MKKSTKKITKKSSLFKSNRSLLLVALAIFVGGSLYLGFSSGTGPLSWFGYPPSVNRIIEEDPNQAKTAIEKKAIENLNQAANKEARAKTDKQKKEAAADLYIAGQVVANIDKDGKPPTNATTIAELEALAKQQLIDKKVITEDVNGKINVTADWDYTTKNNPNNPASNNGSEASGGDTCATNGSPVMAGTWVATGGYVDNDTSKPALCTQCVNKNGKSFEGSANCKDLILSGKLVVLPTHQQDQNINGDTVKLKQCFADIGGGQYVQVAPGQEATHKDNKSICSPSGKLYSTDKAGLAKLDADEAFKSLCDARGQVASGGKCITKTTTITKEPIDPGNIAKIEKERLLKIYDNNKCGGTTVLKSTEKCIPVQGTSGYAIVPKTFTGSIGTTNPKSSQADNVFYSLEKDCVNSIGNTTNLKCVTLPGGGFGQVSKDFFLTYNFGSTSISVQTQDGGQQTDNPGDCKDGTQPAPYGSPKKYLCKNSDGTTFDVQRAISDSITKEYNPANEIVKGNITAGDKCAGNDDNSSCASGDCRFVTKSGDKNSIGNRDWYCMQGSSSEDRTPFYISGPATVVNRFLGKKLAKGQQCFGVDNACVSNYCADNVGFDTCEDNPFTNTNSTQLNSTTIEPRIRVAPEKCSSYGSEQCSIVCGGFNFSCDIAGTSCKCTNAGQEIK